MPIITIIIPCFNHGEYLMDAINSVDQYPQKSIYEIIIIDDGSTDPYTLQILKSLEEKNYTIVKQENMGLAIARNNAIKLSNGKYFLPLDADNKIRTDYLSKGISILDNDESIGLVYGDSLHFGEENKRNIVGKFSLRKLLIENYIDACAIIRKTAWEQCNGYDSKTSVLSDWDLNLSLAESGWNFYYIPEILFDYRVRKESMSNTYKNGEEIRKYIAQKHGGLYRDFHIKNITIKIRIKTLLYDIWQKLIGKPNY